GILLFSTPILAAQVSATVQDSIFERFDEFPEAAQKLVVQRAYEAALACGHPLAIAAQKLEEEAKKQISEARDYEPKRALDAQKWAPALKLTTTYIPRKDKRWKAKEVELFGTFKVPQRRQQWMWDAGRDFLMKPLDPLNPKEQIQRLLNGQWPQPGRLEALLMRQFDTDSTKNHSANYFSHHYRDREGLVFTEMRLDDVWGTGRVLEVSDVEGVAWARIIGNHKTLKSPIPKRAQSPLYQKIAECFEEWREYESLRLALAARHVNPTGVPPLRYSTTLEKLDRAWAAVAHQPEIMLTLLEHNDTRASFFSRLQAFQKAHPEQEQRHGLSEAISAATLQALKDEGLLGVGRR
ncbi:MAG: hypothetical protein MK213_00765, partial [Planctomycetes bacterium]|nr:hypothetical protein [Planctomycetota bacterium]